MRDYCGGSSAGIPKSKAMALARGKEASLRDAETILKSKS
jgi:hypothetical protein